MENPTHKPGEWIAKRQADVAVVYGVSLDTVKSWAKQGMPGVPGAYPLPEISKWLRSTGPWRQHVRPADDDPLLADGDSPGLERYRMAKAQLAEYDLAERTKNLLSRDKARGVLIRWASVIRRMGERLGKRYGADAAIAVNDALTECSYVVDHELGGDESPDSNPEE